MRERVMRLLLLCTGLGLGVLLQPFLVGTARGGEDPLVPPPAAATTVTTTNPSLEMVEYNIYLPPAYPKAEKIVQKLDELGKNGWRLVSTTTNNGGTSGFIFMRNRR